MTARERASMTDIVGRYEDQLLPEWMRHQLAATTLRRDLIRDDELKQQSRRFLDALSKALQDGGAEQGITDPAWEEARDLLSEVSQARARQGFSPSETATFVFSLKQPLFERLRAELERDPVALADAIWKSNALLDQLGLYTTEIYQKNREEVIARQQQEMLELSTPVVELWDGILALPLIGTLDSARTQIVMESLLQRIVDTGAGIAIIDITGVPTVDTLVAQHLLKTVAAARLMGAECIISGIRPQIAQTIVHLGVDLQDVITKATLADAFAVALRNARPGRRATRRRPVGRHGTHSDPQDGRLPAGEHPGGHARPSGDDPAGRSDHSDRRTPALAACSSTSRRSRSSTRSSDGCSATSPPWRACSTRRRWSSGCGPRSRSRSSSSGSRCRASARRSTSRRGWS